MFTSERPDPSIVLPENSTTPPCVLSSIVPVQHTLSLLEIERICRDFIQLVQSPPQEKQRGHKTTTAEEQV